MEAMSKDASLKKRDSWHEALSKDIYMGVR
jgi:hypothetical protein